MRRSALLSSLLCLAATAGCMNPMVDANGDPHLRLVTTTPIKIRSGIGTAGYDVMAVDPGHHRVYMALTDTDSIAVLDTETLTEVTEIYVGQPVQGIAIDTVNQIAYTGGGAPGFVSSVDLRRMARLSENRTYGKPDGVAYDPAAGGIIVTLAARMAVARIDPVSLGFAGLVALPAEPGLPATDSRRGLVYVPLKTPAGLAVLDLRPGENAIVAKPALCGVTVPRSVAYDPALDRLFIPGDNYQMNWLQLPDYTCHSVPDAVGKFADVMVVDSQRHRVYVGNGGENTIDVEDTDGNHLGTFNLRGAPHTMVVDPSDGRLWVSQETTGTVSVLEPY
ncbi:MAG: YncE family protein [Candidatus Dormibacteria bacterium]